MAEINYDFGLDPIPKGRPRMNRRGRTYTPEKTRKYEQNITLMAEMQTNSPPLKGPLVVDLLFRITRPKSSKRMFPNVRPDIDNLAKAVLDAIEGIAFNNDGQIIELNMKKLYVVGPGGTTVHIREVTDDLQQDNRSIQGDS